MKNRIAFQDEIILRNEETGLFPHPHHKNLKIIEDVLQELAPTMSSKLRLIYNPISFDVRILLDKGDNSIIGLVIELEDEINNRIRG